MPTKKQRPEMTVERRQPLTGHLVPPPNDSPENLAEQISDAIQLNQDAAKLIAQREALMTAVEDEMDNIGWPHTTTAIFGKYISPFVPNLTHNMMRLAALQVMQITDAGQLAKWVQDDMCSEFFNRALYYCLKEKQEHKEEKGFIDGSGIGYLEAYRDALKVNIEKTFDSKYFYKLARPLDYVYDTSGIDLTLVANKINPGHWSYPQGHSTKSLTAVQVLRDKFNLDVDVDRNILIAALMFGHGRDQNLIHYPMDTAAAGHNTELKEWKSPPV